MAASPRASSAALLLAHTKPALAGVGRREAWPVTISISQRGNQGPEKKRDSFQSLERTREEAPLAPSLL